MSLFDRLGNKHPTLQRGPANPMQTIQQLRLNPVSFLKQSGFNIPDDMTDPQQIAQHLVRTGQVSNSRYQQAIQMLNSINRR